jgi:iron(III) transport system substrate-binding protein
VGTWVVQMKKLYGWDYFKKLELNKPRIGRSINDTVTMLNAKESIVAAGPSATTLESKAKGNPLAVVYPEDGAVLMVSASGILKNAPAPNAGRLFMEYLLSREGNDVMVQQHQDPVNKHVKPMAGARSIADVKTIRPTPIEIEKGIPEVKELFRETFGI